MKTQHKPEQDNGTSTVYNYNLDNSISSMIDARGAITNYTYNVGTGQVIDMSYVSPNANIPVTPTVYYAYNNFGMKTQMVDGLGYVDYVYNNLGQMTSETRQFNDALPNAPQANNSFKLEYTYTLNGQMKSLKDPYGQQINYGFDKVGRLNNVSGSTAFAGVTNYATTPKYNARGILTHLNYGNGVEMNITNFNNKLQATNFEVKKDTTQIIKKNYEFYGDSSLKYSQDVVNPIFDRSYKYDFASRIMEAKTGAEARGGIVPLENQAAQLPYRQSYNYNVYNQLTQRNNLHWGRESWYWQNNNLSYTYQNNRITNLGNGYDSDGRVVYSGEDNSFATYDAKGEMTRMLTPEASDVYRYNDGNSREGKRKIKRWYEDANGVGSWSLYEEITYFIRSSVLGNETVTEVSPYAEKQKTYITAGGAKLATQLGFGVYENLYFNHQDASGASIRATRIDGSLYNYTDTDDSSAELDPMGGNMGISTPYITLNPLPPDPDDWSYLYNESPMYVNGRAVKYTLDGMAVTQSYGQMYLQSGLIGGQFGLLQMAAEASRPRLIGYGLNIENSWKLGGVSEQGDFENIARSHGYTLHRFFLVNDGWSGFSALAGAIGHDNRGGQTITHEPGQVKALPTTDNGVKTKAEAVKIAKDYLARDKKCLDFINSFLGQLTKITGRNVEGGIEGILNRFLNDPDGLLMHNASDTDGFYGGVKPPGTKSINVSTPQTFDLRRFALLIIHEIIHWEGQGSFGDRQYVQAQQEMGLIISVKDYIKNFSRNIETNNPAFTPEYLAGHRLSSLFPNVYCSPPGNQKAADGVISR